MREVIAVACSGVPGRRATHGLRILDAHERDRWVPISYPFGEQDGRW